MSDLAIQDPPKLRLPHRGLVCSAVVYLPLPPRSSQGLLARRCSSRTATRCSRWRWSRWRRPCPVLAAGLDLSVGALMTMVGCFASYLLSGAPGGTPLVSRLRRMDARPRDAARRRAGHLIGIVICLAIGAFAGLHQRRGRRLRPHPADHRHARHRRHLHRHRALPAAAARRQGRRRPQLGAHQFARRFRLDRPYLQRRRRALVRALRRHPDAFRPPCADRSPGLGSVQPHGHRPDDLRDRVGGRRGLHVRPRRQPRAGSPPSRSAASSRPAADSSSPSRPPRATPTSRRPAPIP